ncbi:nitrous oxidase accessory protein [Evansella vedderi]|uniref:Nitrous oxidase accessory protein n=1 Tax=Evansella vedderi TaxID=38282 RepID=A0ABT9ZQQ7_9BACI|nr:nitrous oxide reductase family maturation protein NosD [Evansella vedderi]MDQ0253295.1 nitrous oxidase accessory protein [Evansella vedderi]
MKKGLLVVFMMLLLFFPKNIEAGGELQGIIDQTPPHGIVELSKKVYEGNITIDKPITIIGVDSTVIRGDGTGNVITINTEEVHLENLQIENSSFDRGSGEEYSGIKVNEGRNTLRNLHISQAYHGIYLSQAHGNVIEQVTIFGQKGKETVAGQGNGIQVYYSNDNEITSNYIEGTRDGIYFEYANKNTLTNNEISHTRYGLHYMYSEDNVFRGNTFAFNIGGAAVMGSRRNEFTNNDFSMNQSSRSFGLLLQASSDNVVIGNHFSNNKRGLLVEQSHHNNISENAFIQNNIGIEIWASSTEQTLTENQFYKNQSPVIQVGGHSENHWSVNGRGNDWGNSFPLLDLNQDGIGDFPVSYYSSLHQLIENNELTYFMINSPSIVVYEKMNQWMNNQRAMFQDDFPLQTRTSLPLMPYSIALVIVGGFVIGIYKRRREAG